MGKEINVKGYVSEQELSDDLKNKIKKIDHIDLAAENIALYNENVKSKNVSDAFSECITKINEASAKADRAFQEADNGKNLIANKIGIPLSANDDFNVLSTKIQNLKDMTATMLRNKNVTNISSSDTFSNILNKINDIPLGKQYKHIDKVMEFDPNSSVNNESIEIYIPFKLSLINISMDSYFDSSHFRRRTQHSIFNENIDATLSKYGPYLDFKAEFISNSNLKITPYFVNCSESFSSAKKIKVTMSIDMYER